MSGTRNVEALIEAVRAIVDAPVWLIPDEGEMTEAHGSLDTDDVNKLWNALVDALAAFPKNQAWPKP